MTPKLPKLITPAVQEAVRQQIADANKQNPPLRLLDRLKQLTAEALKTSAEIDKILKGKK